MQPAPEPIDFDNDAPLLRESWTGYSVDGVLVGVNLKFTNGSDVRFLSHYDELAGLVSSLAASQEGAQGAHVAGEQKGKPLPAPAAWFLPSRISWQSSPEGHLFLSFWGEDAEAGALVARLSPARVRELHAALGHALGQTHSGNPWQPAKAGR
jgi:hypothetical protein